MSIHSLLSQHEPPFASIRFLFLPTSFLNIPRLLMDVALLFQLRNNLYTAGVSFWEGVPLHSVAYLYHGSLVFPLLPFGRHFSHIFTSAEAKMRARRIR